MKAIYISKKLLSKSYVRYIIVGGTSFLIDYLVLLCLYELLNLSLSFSVTVGFIIALIANFLLNKLWTFDSKRENTQQHFKEMFLYGSLVIFNLIFTNLLILAMSKTGIGPAISKPISVACITIWNYIIYKQIIFKS